MAAIKVRYWAPVLFWMGFIFFMSNRKGNDIPSVFPFQDIVFHFCVYAALAWLFGRALYFQKPGLNIIKIICVSAVFGLLYGFTDEYHQSFISGRSCSGFDVIIDLAGSFIGGLTVRWLK